MRDSLIPFFKQKSVAVIGASQNPKKLSNGIVKNLLAYGYKGAVYPINPKVNEILGLKCYASILEVKEPVDLAVIILPAKIIARVITECGKKGVKAIIVISGGFKEVGAEGALLEKDLLDIVYKYHMRMIGPNCVGTMNLITGLNTTFIRGVPAVGGIGFISQSGAVCGGVVVHIAHKGIGFSHFLSLGNEADVTEADMIEYLAEDADTSVIAAYIEGVRDGRRFIKVGRKVTANKPIVVLKAGRSKEGAKAVSSHTGSLAGSHAAYKAAFSQSGMIEVFSITDLLNCSMALDWLKPPSGNRAVIVTNSGGPAALASDSFSDYGIQLAELSLDTKKALAGKLNPSAQVGNPVDMLGGAAEDEYAHALQNALKDDGVDMALAILVPQSLVNPEKIANAIVEASKKAEKPIIACMMGFESVQGARKLLHANKIPMVDFPTQTGVMFNALLQHRKNSKHTVPERVENVAESREKVAQIINARSGLKNWGEHYTRGVLAGYDIPLVKGLLAVSLAEAMRIAEEIGYPVVLKGASKDVLHKSDLQAVRVGIKDKDALAKAYRSISEKILKVKPEATLDGMMVEKMAPEGKEVIIGMKRDPSFGPLIMFGMGGVFVELFKDVAFRIAPLKMEDIQEMMESTKAYQLLNGWRGGNNLILLRSQMLL
ncbi:MAG: acetate--CoA ligase family protein [Anaerolineaceae bacterium]|nr:acetate--CoA ligase family protein [Anaerolineaceae bacterium]